MFTLNCAKCYLSENHKTQLTSEQFEQTATSLPRQRGNVRLASLQVVNAILYVAANGCKWRALPGHYGPWHSIYMRMSRWAKAGVLNTVFEQLQRQGLMNVRIEALSLDSTTGDAPEARPLIEAMDPQEAGAVALLMDGAYQDNATRELAQAMGFVPVVPPSPTRREPWLLDKARYRKRPGNTS